MTAEVVKIHRHVLSFAFLRWPTVIMSSTIQYSYLKPYSGAHPKGGGRWMWSPISPVGN